MPFHSLIKFVVYIAKPPCPMEKNVRLCKHLQATNGLFVSIAELFIVWDFLARVSDVVFGMKVTAQLFANFVTGFICPCQAVANALGHISQLLFVPVLFSNIQLTSMSTSLARL